MASLGRLTMTRAQAKERGLTRYFTGKPCKRGHISERNVSSCSCVDCSRQISKRHYEKNKDQIRKRHAQWMKENSGSFKEYRKRYDELNPEKSLAKSRRYNERNRQKKAEVARSVYAEKRDEILARNALWQKNNPDKMLAYSRNRDARERSAEGTHTSSDVKRLFMSQGGQCAGCGCHLVKSGKGKYHVDHIMPLSKGGSNWPSNLQLLCPPCNLSKADKHPDDWAMGVSLDG